MRSKVARCACGLPLHYSTKKLEDEVTAIVAELGEWMHVHVGHEKYEIQRHYLALHGFKPEQAAQLLAQNIIRYSKE